MEFQLRNSDEQKKNEAVSHLLQINANLMTFARGIVSKSGSSSAKYTRLVLSPSLSEAVRQSNVDFEDRTQNSSSSGAPSLGHVLVAIKNLAQVLVKSDSSRSELMENIRQINHLSSGELNSFLPSNFGDRLSSSERRALAVRKMEEMTLAKEKEMSLAGSAVENAVFLLWRHLEHFILVEGATDVTPYQKAYKNVHEELMADSGLRAESELMTSTSLQRLKDDALGCIDDSLYMTLQTVDSIRNKNKDLSSGSTFLEITIRRLRRLSTA